MLSILKSAALMAVFAVPAAALAAPQTYHFDSAHTNVVWSASHFGFSSPSGKFPDTEGTIILDKDNPAASKVNFTVRTGSVLTGLAQFDDHLKSKDFLHIEKHPAATFQSTKVTVTGKDTATVDGNFTLRGVTKPVSLDVKLNKLGPNPMSDKQTAGFTAHTALKRSDYGITYALPGVSDEVKIHIEAEAILADR